MVRKSLLTALLASVLAAAATASAGSTPGVSATQILIGGTVPLTGEAAAGASIARGADAYFKYVNARGGVLGRRISYKYLDNAYDPAQTVQATRQLVQQDQVFAIFQSLGTAANLAVRDFLNQSGVPQVLVASGAHTFGADYAKYPWTIGFIPSYVTEGTVYGRTIAKTMPKAKVAVLYQDDEYGHDLLNGLTSGLGANAGQIVAKAGYDPTQPDVQSQISQLKQSGADTLCIFAFGKYSIQAFVYADKLGWHPQVFVNDVASATSVMRLSPPAATEHAISIVFAKDPGDRAWAKDPGFRLEQKILKTYAKGADLKDGYYMAGMAAAYTLVDALTKAGKNLTRDGLMKAITSLNEPANPFLLPGIAVRTAPSYRFPISQVQLQRWHAGNWQRFGPVLTARG